MTWREQEAEYRRLQRQLAQLAAEEADRERNPELYEEREIPAVWNWSDLRQDHERDAGR